MTSGQNYDQNQPVFPITPYDVEAGLRGGKYMSIGRVSVPPTLLNFGTSAAPVGVPTLPVAGDAADTVTELQFAEAYGHRGVELYQSTAQALKPLLHASKGIEIALDQVDNETVEYVPGGNKASNPLGYLAGTDPGVFIRATLEFTTNNGIDQLMVGFRKQQAYANPAATWNYNGQVPGYTDFVGIGFAAAVTNPNQLRMATSVANAACVTSALGFTIASGGIHQIEVRIKRRVAAVFINGVRVGDTVKKDGLGAVITAQPTTTPPVYTVTSALFMIPFILIRQDAGLSTVFLRGLEVGQLLAVGLQPESRGPVRLA